jgi:hypothetical protein
LISTRLLAKFIAMPTSTPRREEDVDRDAVAAFVHAERPDGALLRAARAGQILSALPAGERIAGAALPSERVRRSPPGQR